MVNCLAPACAKKHKVGSLPVQHMLPEILAAQEGIFKGPEMEVFHLKCLELGATESKQFPTFPGSAYAHEG